MKIKIIGVLGVVFLLCRSLLQPPCHRQHVGAQRLPSKVPQYTVVSVKLLNQHFLLMMIGVWHNHILNNRRLFAPPCLIFYVKDDERQERLLEPPCSATDPRPRQPPQQHAKTFFHPPACQCHVAIWVLAHPSPLPPAAWAARRRRSMSWAWIVIPVIPVSAPSPKWSMRLWLPPRPLVVIFFSGMGSFCLCVPRDSLFAPVRLVSFVLWPVPNLPQVLKQKVRPA